MRLSLSVIWVFMAVFAAASQNGGGTVTTTQVIRLLDADTKMLFSGAARRKDLTISTLITGVVSTYSAHDYTDAQIASALASLARVAHSGQQKTALYVDRRVLTVYVDVTCARCSKILEVIGAARDRRAEAFPKIALRLVAAPNDASAQAAAYELEVIRHLAPDRFEEAVWEFSRILPQHPNASAQLRKAYVADRTVSSSSASRIRTVVRLNREILLQNKLWAPVVVFGRRVLEPMPSTGFGHITYNALENHELLNLSLDILEYLNEKVAANHD